MDVINLLAHLSVPRTSNNHKARLLHTEIIVLIALAFVGFQFLIGFGNKSMPGVLGYAANISIDEVVNLTNQKRQEQGVGTLTFSSDLAQAAKLKGQDMLADNYWAHVAPDGTQPWDFFASVGYSYRYAGENLARDFSNPNSAVDAWMASPSHRDNLLSSKYNEIGVAVVEGDLDGVDTTIIVQLFGTRSQSLAEVPAVSAAVTDEQPEPEIQPTVELEPVKVVNAADISEVSAASVISPFIATRTIAFIIIGMLAIIMVIDVIEIERKGVSRVGGRRIAHLSYLVTIIIILLVARAGEIL